MPTSTAIAAACPRAASSQTPRIRHATVTRRADEGGDTQGSPSCRTPQFPAACLASTAALAAATPALAAPFFDRIASFPVARNLPEGADPATADLGRDRRRERRRHDARLHRQPEQGGRLHRHRRPRRARRRSAASPSTASRPRSSIRGATAFVGVNTRASFTEPSGRLAAVDLATRAETASCDLGGQPDSVAVAPDGSFVAVAIENERDEEVNDGAIPQMPAGCVAIVPLADGAMRLRRPDPRRPDRPRRDRARGPRARVRRRQRRRRDRGDAAGEQPRRHPRPRRHGARALLRRRRRPRGHRPDRGRRARLHRDRRPASCASPTRSSGSAPTASPSPTRATGRAAAAASPSSTATAASPSRAAPAFEHAIAAIGHYPDGRSDAKGVEPEGLEFARFGDTDYLFVLVRARLGRRRLPHRGRHPGAAPAPALRHLARGRHRDPVAQPPRHRQRGRPRRGRPRPRPRHALRARRRARRRPIRRSPRRRHRRARSAGAPSPASPPTRRRPAGSSPSATASTACSRASSRSTPPPRRRASSAPSTSPATASPAQKLDIEGIAPDGEGGFWLASEGRSDRLIPHAL